MAWVSYDYTTHTDKKTYETVFRPLIDVRVVAPEGFKILHSFLIDSGANSALINAELAGALNINLDLCPEEMVKGVGSVPVTGRKCDTEIFIDTFKQSLKVEALFVPNLGVDGLLGQRDFFTNYYVRFDKPKGKFALAPVPKLKF